MLNSTENRLSDDRFYSQYFQKALSVGSYFCRDNDLAQEVAQLTTIKLYLCQDKVNIPDKWVYQVARTYALQFMKNKKVTHQINRELKDTLHFSSYPDLFDNPDLELIISRIPDELLTFEEKEFARDHFLMGISREDLQDRYTLTEEQFAEKIYHLKQEIFLFLKFEGEFKVVQKIPGTQLNRNIMNFVHVLKKCLEKQEFTPLKKYIEENIDYAKLNNAEKIKKFLGYELRFLETGVYQLYANYLSEKGYPYTIFLVIRIVDWKKIRIVSGPRLPEKIYKINSAELKDEAQLLIKKKHNGEQILSWQEEFELLKKTKAEMVFSV